MLLFSSSRHKVSLIMFGDRSQNQYNFKLKLPHHPLNSRPINFNMILAKVSTICQLFAHNQSTNIFKDRPSDPLACKLNNKPVPLQGIDINVR